MEPHPGHDGQIDPVAFTRTLLEPRHCEGTSAKQSSRANQALSVNFGASHSHMVARKPEC